MPHFTYKAKNASLQTVEGELIAETESDALSRLESMGYCPVWVRERELATPDTDLDPYRGERIPSRDVTIFTRQLAGLIKSGVPILRALHTVREQGTNPRFRRVVSGLEEMVRDGRMVSDALSRYPAVFPELYVNLVRSGESAGILDVVLQRLAEARDREDDVRRKLQAASAYPLLVLGVGVVTVFVMLTFFMPKIAAVLDNSAIPMPLPTKILLGISSGVRNYWIWVLAPLILLWAVLRRMTSGGKGRLVLDTAILNLPLVGTFVIESNVARFARTMSLLVRSGIAIEKSLMLSAGTLGNAALKAEIDTVRKLTVQQGRTVSSGLKGARYFPRYAHSMAAVGEEGGRLDESMADVATFYEKELDRRINMITALVEPVLILTVGAVVGFIVFAMMLPIFEISRIVR